MTDRAGCSHPTGGDRQHDEGEDIGEGADQLRRGVDGLGGLELIGRTPVAQGWELFGSYTFTDAFTASGATETRAIRVPRHDLVIGVEGQITDRLSGILTVQHTADFWDAGLWPAPASKMPDYTVANLALTYDINDRTAAYLRVENLFDEDYQTVRNYGQPGRQVFLGVQAKF